MTTFLVGAGCLVVGFIGGYLTCFLWGKSRKAIKEAAAKGAKEISGAADRVGKQ